MPKICEVENCWFPARAMGMCKTHRQRFLEYGRTHKIMTGEKTKHPLFTMWNGRRQRKNAFVEKWMNFDAFIIDVGAKPEGCYLARLNESLSCGPDNFEWRKIKHPKLKDETIKEYSKRIRKYFREANPLEARERNYKHKFNLTLEEYEAKLKSQNHVCAICEQFETVKYKSTDIVKNLAVDHCHITGKIRKLLCSKCNLFVGKLEDNLNQIDKFINYVKEHQ